MKNLTPSLLVAPLLLTSTALAQWLPPTLAGACNTASSEFDPCLTIDGLTLYYASQSPGQFDLFRATRAAPYTQFGVGTPITELNSTGTEAGPCVRIDDLEIFFYSTRVGGAGSLDIWRATRASTALPFGAPTPVTEINSSSSDGGSSLTVDGLRIYFTSARPGGLGTDDIWTATRPDWFSPFSVPTPVTELNSSSSDREPHISPDGLVIFFTSGRAGGVGGNDTWMASRLTTSAPFGPPVNVTVLNTSVADVSPAFALFSDEIIFTSIRAGGPGSYDLYTSRFTGLVANGIASTSSSRDLRFSDPSSPGALYVAISALGSTPGIPIDTRVLPLNPDILFTLTIGGLPPVLNGYVGTLDSNGVASGSMAFNGFPQLIGLRFFTAFVVFDAAAPSGIKTISNALETEVQ